MKKFNLFLIILAMSFLGAKAERINITGLDLPQLIISEVRPAGEAEAYVEITNMGDTTLDLSSFVIYSGWGNTRVLTYTDSLLVWSGLTNEAVQGHLGRVYLKGDLAPGESFVVSSAWDRNDAYGRGIPFHNTAVAALSDQLVHKREETNQNGWIDKPEWQCYPFDSVSPINYTPTLRYPQLFGNAAGYGNSSAFYLISWRFQVDSATIDSTYIDNFNFYYEGTNTVKGNGQRKSVAGMDQEHVDYVFVRKSSVDQPNMNWDQSRGVDALTSEWIVLEEPSSKQFAFTTVGHHGVANMQVKAKDESIIQIDEANKTLSVPSNIYRYDSLSYYFDLAPGMAWSYKMNSSFEDTAKFTVCTGDTITFYALGDEATSASYHINVRPAEDDLAEVFPTRRLVQIFNEEGDSVIDQVWTANFVYGVTSGLPQDSITGVGFATRVDSLYKYLIKPDSAEWEIIFHDNEARVDVEVGDVLRVTSADGSNYKDYALSVNDYMPSSNARLSVVTWPDINPALNPRWTQNDTMVEFSSNKLAYTIDIFPTIKEVPALQFKPVDSRSTVSVERAQNLKGSIDERTTKVTVTAQDDSTTITYNFTFRQMSIEGEQPYVAEPFFSEFIWQHGHQGWAIEIFNPGTEPLDISQYAILKDESGTKTWEEIIEAEPQAWNDSKGLRMYEFFYVPARRWKNDGSKEDWEMQPTVDNPTLGAGFLRPDNETDPIIKPKDVFVAGVATKTFMWILRPADFVFTGFTGGIYNGEYNPLWDQFAWSDSTFLYLQANPAWNDKHGCYYLVKIKNDSILDGQMRVDNDVYNNYELIDMFVPKGDTINLKKTTDSKTYKNGQKNWFCRRKADSYYPITWPVGGAKETLEESDWIAYSKSWPDWSDLPAGTGISDDLGQHITDPITGYLSTITSSSFNVDLGYQGDALKIVGDVAAYTPTTILDAINKATPNQTLTFKRGDNVVGATEKLAGGDVLTVTSDDGKNQTSYTLVQAPLNDDTSLTAKAGSGLTVTGTVVSGVDPMSTVKDLLTKVEVDSKSVIEIEDANGGVQPKIVHNRDTMVYDLQVSSNVKLAVRAESGAKTVYSLDFGFGDSDAYLFSTIYPIDQDKKLLASYPQGLTPKSIKDYVFANEGATYRILDKNNYERVVGNIRIDDKIEVTSKDGTKKVIYNFFSEFYNAIEPISVANSNLALYPNPAKNTLFIKGANVKSVAVYALSGQKLLDESVFGGSLDVSALAKGVYLVAIEDQQGASTTLKFMKE